MSSIASWFNALWVVLASPYLKWFWFVVLGYVGCWLLALFLTNLGSSRTTTTVYRCRQSLAIAVFLHCLTLLIVTGLWWREYFPFRGFYWFLTPYLALILADLAVGIKLMVGLGSYRHFGR